MRKYVQAVLFCVLLLFIGRAGLCFTCGSSVVSAGDTKVEVLLKCGEPAFKESHDEEITTRIDETTKRRETVTVEQWTYNPGPQSFLRILEFRNGKLVDIRTGGYGYSRLAGSAAACEDLKIGEETRKIDVLALCGEPLGKDERLEEIAEEVAPGIRKKVIVTVEEWTYNLGPNKFMRILTFRNGRLVDIRNGNYGR